MSDVLRKFGTGLLWVGIIGGIFAGASIMLIGIGTVALLPFRPPEMGFDSWQRLFSGLGVVVVLLGIYGFGGWIIQLHEEEEEYKRRFGEG